MTEGNEGKGNFGLLFLAVVIDLLGFGIIIPILPFLVKDVDPSQEGLLLALLLAIYSLAQFASAPFWGRLSDKIGRRPIILVGLIGSAFGFTIFGFARTYPLYLFARLLAGIFTGATLPTSRAYIADITPPEDRARRYGLLGAAFGIGFTFGPAIGSLLSLQFFAISGLPKQAPAALFAALLALINFILARSRLPESLHMSINLSNQIESTSVIQQFKYLLSLKQLPILLVIFGMTTLIFSGFETILALYANQIDNRITETNIGYYFAAIGILIAVVQSSLVGPAVNRLGEEGTIVFAIILQTIGFGLLAITNSLLFLSFVIVPLATGTALLNPAINAAISNRIPANRQGSGLGINSSLGSLGRVVGPLYGGILYDFFSPQTPFWISSFLLFLIVVVTFRQLLHASQISRNYRQDSLITD